MVTHRLTRNLWILVGIIFAHYVNAAAGAFLIQRTSDIARGVSRSLPLFQSTPEDCNNEETQVNVKITYDGFTRDIPVFRNESILNAMERMNIAQKMGLPDLPSDCRKGCCLTCSAIHAENSVTSNLYVGTDGLNPSLSTELSDNGFVLTCSSYVRGNGVHLSLNQNVEAWQAMYRERFESEGLQLAGRKAMARVIRRNAERRLDEWIRETERVLERP
jgi:hypothetical protein